MARPPKGTARPSSAKALSAGDNQLAPAKTRARLMSDREPDPLPAVQRDENTLAPAKTRERKAPQAEAQMPAAPILTKGALPAAVARRYNAEPGLFRRHIDYYEGGGAKRPAFRDRGDRLVAFQTDPATVAALLAIARHRGWSSLEVRGDDVFRREIWMEAQQLGLKVKGYRPKARDREEADKRAQDRASSTRRPSHAGPRKAARDGPAEARDTAATRGARSPSATRAKTTAKPEKQAPAAPAPRPSKSAARQAANPTPATTKTRAALDFDKGVTGVFLEAGSAPYQNRKGASLTPFVRLDIGAAKAMTVWGVGLPEAVVAARARAGDTLTLRREGSDTVVLSKDAVGGPKVVERNRWTAIAERFRESSAAGAARDPDLANAQARLAVVETVVRSKLADPKDRAKVSAAAKSKIADHLEKGHAFTAPKIAEPTRRRGRADGADEREKGPERVRGR